MSDKRAIVEKIEKSTGRRQKTPLTLFLPFRNTTLPPPSFLLSTSDFDGFMSFQLRASVALLADGDLIRWLACRSWEGRVRGRIKRLAEKCGCAGRMFGHLCKAFGDEIPMDVFMRFSDEILLPEMAAANGEIMREIVAGGVTMGELAKSHEDALSHDDRFWQWRGNFLNDVNNSIQNSITHSTKTYKEI